MISNQRPPIRRLTLSPCNAVSDRDYIGYRISDPSIRITRLYDHAIAVSRQTGTIGPILVPRLGWETSLFPHVNKGKMKSTNPIRRYQKRPISNLESAILRFQDMTLSLPSRLQTNRDDIGSPNHDPRFQEMTLSPCHRSLQTNRENIGSRISDPPIPTGLYHQAIRSPYKTDDIRISSRSLIPKTCSIYAITQSPEKQNDIELAILRPQTRLYHHGFAVSRQTGTISGSPNQRSLDSNDISLSPMPSQSPEKQR
ncbi:hypothetical protein AVEN_215091-1 [Araneus ventricosus]|uniref:Uncharacterized protein n=1 Tax=Araneus ventricosus TaxID=182803 RepID=A0A4Y2WZJ3_ARAVE|nr:hypothetical protein AVEN_215091-1 [Araneus ventricosus]